MGSKVFSVINSTEGTSFNFDARGMVASKAHSLRLYALFRVDLQLAKVAKASYVLIVSI